MRVRKLSQPLAYIIFNIKNRNLLFTVTSDDAAIGFFWLIVSSAIHVYRPESDGRDFCISNIDTLSSSTAPRVVMETR